MKSNKRYSYSNVQPSRSALNYWIKEQTIVDCWRLLGKNTERADRKNTECFAPALKLGISYWLLVKFCSHHGTSIKAPIHLDTASAYTLYYMSFSHISQTPRRALIGSFSRVTPHYLCCSRYSWR